MLITNTCPDGVDCINRCNDNIYKILKCNCNRYSMHNYYNRGELFKVGVFVQPFGYL